MALSADDIALARIEHTDATLGELTRRHTRVQSALSAAQEALSRAQQEVEALTKEDVALHASRLKLAAELLAQRTARERAQREHAARRVQRLLATFPRELLQAIFLEATNVEDDVWRDDMRDWHEVDFSSGSICAPFAIATVNRLWREVALGTGRMWTFLATSKLDDDCSEFVDYTKTMLRRSKNHDIDLLFLWSDSSWNASRYYREILDVVAKSAHRLHRVVIELPRDTPDGALAFLPLPMPRLVHLHLTYDDSSPPQFSVFPTCPRLRRLCDEVLPTPQYPLINLTHAHLRVPHVSPAWKALAMMPAVEDVELYIYDGDIEAQSLSTRSNLTLPNVRCFGLYGYGPEFAYWASYLHMPRLSELRLCPTTISHAQEFDDEVAEAVTTLVLYEIDHSDLGERRWQAVRRLQHLEHIIFHDCSALDPDLSSILTSRECAGLPHLLSITFESPVLDDDSAARLLAVMQSPQICPGHSKDGTISFTLDADEDDVPDWLIRQYEFFCGDLLEPGDEDPDATEGETPSTDDESDEAQFTDGGSGSPYTSDSEWEEGSSTDSSINVS